VAKSTGRNPFSNPVIRKLVSEIEKTIDSSSIVLSSNIQKYFGPGEEVVYLKGHVTIIDSSILEIALFATESRGTLSIDK
jgi:ABC-type transporter Mla maintaining outer membrane lipid asymmetry ATPase subunit MlaF